MKCSECSGKMVEKESTLPDGVQYGYYKCTECGDEILDMTQLNKIAGKYRAMRKYTVKISTWGNSRGIRIPKELEKEYGLEKKKEVYLLPEKGSIRIMAK